MIQGHGPNNPQVVFISDSAVGEDFKTNLAISGYQEFKLKSLAEKAGFNYREAWKTCLIKEKAIRAPDWTFKYLKANKTKIDLYSPILYEEIKSLEPNLLIPLGEIGFNFCTSLNGIRKFRGSVLNSNIHLPGVDRNYKVLPILGPYPYLNEEERLSYISKIDFNKINVNKHSDPIPDKKYHCWIAQTSGALRAFIERSYPNAKFLVFDIETFKGIPTCISFCFDGNESCCVPLLDKSIDFDTRVLFIEQIARLLASPIKKGNQNIGFDWKVLERWGFTVSNVVYDSMLAASVLYCEFPKNLGFLTSIYTELPYFKDEGREFNPIIHKKEQLYLYNAKDSLSTYQIITKQSTELEEQGVREVYNNLVKLIPIYKRIEETGIRRDEEQRLKLLAKYESLFRIHSLKLNNLLNEPVNPLSSIQMNRVVFDVLRYKKLRNANDTTEDSLMLLKILSEASAAPSTGPLVIDEIIACRKFHKVIEILELPVWPDERFRGNYNLAGTETGRSSGSKTLDELLFFDEKGRIKAIRLGHSLQTFGKHGFAVDGVTYGKDIRSIFVPSVGYSFVECDLQGAEARVDVVLANCLHFLAYFENPGIHKLTGSWCFNCKPEEVKKGVLVDGIDRYHTAKQVRHSGERNITAEGLVTKFLWGISLQEGKRLLDEFHKKQPEIRQVYHKDVIRCVGTTRCLVAPNGRRRDFFDRITNATYNEAISFLPQAIVSDQTKFSLIKTTTDMPEARILQESHDGVLAEVPIGSELRYAQIYKVNIETPIDFTSCSLSRNYKLIIPCEVSVSKENWEVMEEVKL